MEQVNFPTVESAIGLYHLPIYNEKNICLRDPVMAASIIESMRIIDMILSIPDVILYGERVINLLRYAIYCEKINSQSDNKDLITHPMQYDDNFELYKYIVYADSEDTKNGFIMTYEARIALCSKLDLNNVTFRIYYNSVKEEYIQIHILSNMLTFKITKYIDDGMNDILFNDIRHTADSLFVYGKTCANKTKLGTPRAISINNLWFETSTNIYIKDIIDTTLNGISVLIMTNTLNIEQSIDAIKKRPYGIHTILTVSLETASIILKPDINYLSSDKYYTSLNKKLLALNNIKKIEFHTSISKLVYKCIQCEKSIHKSRNMSLVSILDDNSLICIKCIKQMQYVNYLNNYTTIINSAMAELFSK